MGGMGQAQYDLIVPFGSLDNPLLELLRTLSKSQREHEASTEQVLRPKGAPRRAGLGLARAPRVRFGKESPCTRSVRQSSKSCGFCSYNVRTSSKRHRQVICTPKSGHKGIVFYASFVKLNSKVDKYM